MKKLQSAKKLRLQKSTLRSLSRDENRAVNGGSFYVWCNGPVTGTINEAPRSGTILSPPGGNSILKAKCDPSQDTFCFPG